jgi:4-amino-4-deoxy-L-arabinose transferase-like glycosyltransferase
MSSLRILGLSPAFAAGLLIAAATLVRFFLTGWLPLLPDEAYYWQWSRHLDASYISKGPAVAYTIAAGRMLFGDTNLGIRFFAVALSAGTAWQVFLLARRWYDEVTGLIAVLLVSIVPLYAVGAIVMTIDPLSAFFWVWAANLFSRAVTAGRWRDWLLTGFAVGCGFLGKYLNALELVAFLVFLLAVPLRRRWLVRPQFWAMLGVAIFCTLPVVWWNAKHGWVTKGQLEHRGGLDGPLTIHLPTFLNFLELQSVMVSPLLFVALLVLAVTLLAGWLRGRSPSEGDTLLLLLFLSVFAFYAALAFHLRCEPNWPAVSYLSLIVVLASRWKVQLEKPRGHSFIATAFVLGWIESLALYYASVLPLPASFDPSERTVGWSQVADDLGRLRDEQQASVFIADSYKEASIFSFYLPDHRFYTKHHWPPATEYDFWPSYPTTPPNVALWITNDLTPDALAADFNSIALVQRVQVTFRGKVVRHYDIYRCENR